MLKQYLCLLVFLSSALSKNYRSEREMHSTTQERLSIPSVVLCIRA